MVITIKTTSFQITSDRFLSSSDPELILDTLSLISYQYSHLESLIPDRIK